ncbi:hypothetical protein [Chitinophaga japonensis]|uniref:Uncharacterized protein n=1 Tax=Chitinophaga japonensis TaxID=104662 RepID=A0A562SMX4_CHIJA|nr:hypothetical protein [Chitinophaga japonensis]TWI82040.1 hypothetical protein LX66_5357 [Chitinophaga japonensis]
MKRAKIALTAIVMFAVVGGALAFKSYRGITTYYRLTADGTGECTLTNVNFGPVPSPAGTVYATTIEGVDCTMRANISGGM